MNGLYCMAKFTEQMTSMPLKPTIVHYLEGIAKATSVLLTECVLGIPDAFEVLSIGGKSGCSGPRWLVAESGITNGAGRHLDGERASLDTE